MTNESLLIEHYYRLIERIRCLAAQYHRPPNSIRLLAVSKSQPLDKIQPLIQAGQLDFGENYVVEGLNKISAPPLVNAPPLNWHFIGQIQSNKLRAIATHFNWVQTVTTLEQAKKLSFYRSLSSHNPSHLNVCIQVNISKSKNKQGALPEINQLEDLLNNVSSLDNVVLRGLMAIPDAEETFAAQHRPLKYMAELFTELQSRGLNLDTLSMGMSQDLEAAISAGSTLLRIGTALFGPRKSI